MPSSKPAIAVVNNEACLQQNQVMLHRIRNMWEFACLYQWIYIFGKAAKIDEDIDISDLETECLKQQSTLLCDIALALLKLILSQRGLTYGSFDHHAKQQYTYMSVSPNPFGNEVEPYHFVEFDAVIKIKVLQQLTQWAMIRPERLRDKMEEIKDSEQTSWRIEPYGWDRHDRTYYVLDDNRVYRLSTPSQPPYGKQTTDKISRRSARGSSKWQPKLYNSDGDDQTMDTDTSVDKVEENHDNNGLGGMMWECVAITLYEVQALTEELTRTHDENEQVLKSQLELHLLPILEKQEDERKRRELRRERELLNLEKMANAKRSSRIAIKVEQRREEERIREEQKLIQLAEAAQIKDLQFRQRIERERDMRVASRETRSRVRELRRLQHQEQLSLLAASKTANVRTGRISERYLETEIEKNRLALHELEAEEEEWVFDCICGMYGHVDDGAHSIACERCNVWQHSGCLGISETIADDSKFHFICTACCENNHLAAKATEQLIPSHIGEQDSIVSGG